MVASADSSSRALLGGGGSGRGCGLQGKILKTGDRTDYLIEFWHSPMSRRYDPHFFRSENCILREPKAPQLVLGGAGWEHVF